MNDKINKTKKKEVIMNLLNRWMGIHDKINSIMEKEKKKPMKKKAKLCAFIDSNGTVEKVKIIPGYQKSNNNDFLVIKEFEGPSFNFCKKLITEYLKTENCNNWICDKFVE